MGGQGGPPGVGWAIKGVSWPREQLQLHDPLGNEEQVEVGRILKGTGSQSMVPGSAQDIKGVLVGNADSWVSPTQPC